MPAISVVMPVFNGEQYLSEAVESVSVQSLRDWELIIVDDGSTDATPEILCTLQDPRITTIRQENLGPAAARNAGLDAAQGKFIAFLDADDLYLPTALSDLSYFLGIHPEYDIVYSDGIICDQDRRHLMLLSEHRPGIYTGNILEQVVLSSSVIGIPICTLTRRVVIERFGLCFDTELNVGSDSYFWVQAARHAQFGYLAKATCMYRIHQKNISRTTTRGARQETHYLARKKIMQSEWFNELSLATRLQFFHYLLTTLLSSMMEEQSNVMTTKPFLDLPAVGQAQMYRMVADSYLLQGRETEFAEACLERSLMMVPSDRKSNILRTLLRISPRLCWLMLITWKEMNSSWKHLRSMRQRKPKPVPAPLSQSVYGK